MEMDSAGPFYFTQDYHRQYLANNPMSDYGLGAAVGPYAVELSAI